MNRVELAARVLEAEPLRHTPAGIPVLRLRMEHESEVLEAGLPRKLAFALDAVALGETASSLGQVLPGSRIRAIGFLAPARQGSNRLILHIQQVAQAQ